MRRPRGDEPGLDLLGGRWTSVLEGVAAALGDYRPLLLERA